MLMVAWAYRSHPMNQSSKKKPHKSHISPAQQIARQEQKEKMLAAAAYLFCHCGFQTTTLDELAARVGLTKPRLFVHFKGKEQILKACVERALHQWRDVIGELKSGQSRSGEKAVGPFIERYAGIAFGDFGMCLMRRELEYLGAKERDMLLRQKADIDADFKILFAAALRGESRSDADPEFLWLMVTVLVQGIALLEHPVPEKLVMVSRAVRTMFDTDQNQVGLSRRC